MASYILNNQISDGTANLSYLLGPDLHQAISELTPAIVAEVFGEGDARAIDLSSGYRDPEWYWQSSDGCVWGLGWRWGCTRLRGRGAVSRGNFFYDHPSPDSAREFVEYLMSRVGGSE